MPSFILAQLENLVPGNCSENNLLKLHIYSECVLHQQKTFTEKIKYSQEESCLYDKTFLEKCSTHILTPDKDSTTEQSVATTQIQLGEPVGFTVFIGAEMTQ